MRIGEQWLSWEEVKFYAALFDFPTVPELDFKTKISDFYQPNLDENKQLEKWLTENLGMTWLESTNTSGCLGGFDTQTNNPASEGFVIRNKEAFMSNDGVLPVADNEFNNLFKLVRASHINTDEHWTKHWQPTTLLDGEKYKWYGYNYKSK